MSTLNDVVVADSTVIKLHRLRARRYPGTWTNSSPAVAMLHGVMRMTGAAMKAVKLTDERANDHRTLRVGPGVHDRLLAFDPGCCRYQLLDCIGRNGGCFLTCLPAHACLQIADVHRRWRGRNNELEGRRLYEVVGQLERAILT